ncbi:Leucine-rich repeat-containing protein 71 [Geranomyces michiganensis]|nr:Leucine-rich repeat-containing protein 71 [Geranomyces michiganensis]
MTVEVQQPLEETIPAPPEYTGNFGADFTEACKRRGCKPFNVLTVKYPLPPLPVPVTPRRTSLVAAAGGSDGEHPDAAAAGSAGGEEPASGEEKTATSPSSPDANQPPGPTTTTAAATATPTTDGLEEQQSKSKLGPKLMNYQSRFRFAPTLVLETGEDDDEDLQKLEVRGWAIAPEIMEIISSLVSSCGSFTTLAFWNCGLTGAHITPLSSALPSTSVTTLSIDQNFRIPPAAFADLISEDSPVRHLSLRSNMMGDAGAKALAEQLKVNKTLVSLNLWDNQIGKEGVEAIAEALRVNQTLLSLSLGMNTVGDDGASALAKVLSNYPLSHEELATRRKAMADMDKQRKDQEEDPVVKNKAKNRTLTSGGSAAQGRNNSAKMGTKIQSTENLAGAGPPGKKDAVAIDPKTKKAIKGGAAATSKTEATPAAAPAKGGAAAAAAAAAAAGTGTTSTATGTKQAAAPAAAAGGGGAAKKGAAVATAAAAAPDAAAKGGKAAKALLPAKGGKKGKAEEVKEEVEEVVEATPASEPMFEHNGQWFILGNRTLNNLNLYNSGIRDEGLKALWEALQQQEATAEHAAEGSIGVFRLTLQANAFEPNHPLLAQITSFLNARNPYYESPLEESDVELESAVEGDKASVTDAA